MATATTTMLATKPLYAVLPADDLVRARRFYHDMLGLTVDDVDGGFLVHTGGGTQFMVYHTEMSHASGNTVAGWVVDDLTSAVRDLRSHGIKFEDYDLPYLKTTDGIAQTPMGPAAWFKDTEGNIINVAQM